MVQSSVRPRVCVIATTPLSVYFFFLPHLKQLSEWAEVDLVVNPANDNYVPSLDLNVRVVPVPIKRPISVFYDLKAFFQLWKVLRSGKYDLVWATAPKAGLLGMIAARMAGISARVFVFQGEVWASKRGVFRYVLKWADKLTAASSTHLLAVSQSERSFLEDERVVSKGKIRVLGEGSISGVDLARYAPSEKLRSEVRAELGIPFDATVVLFVGRKVADKGIYELVAAYRQLAAQYPNFWLLAVGPDEDQVEASLIRGLAECAEHVRFVGFTGHPERYMAASDFICLPSHREGFGLVIIEAGALGLPAIGTNIYGISDAIKNEVTGLLFDKGDVADLAKAIARLLDDVELRNRLGAAAREHAVVAFDQRVVVRGYSEFLANLVNATG